MNQLNIGVLNTTNRCSSLESVSVFHELSLGTTHSLYFSRPSVDNPLNARKSPSSFSAPDGKVAAKSNLSTSTPAFNHRANNRRRNLRIILRGKKEQYTCRSMYIESWIKNWNIVEVKKKNLICRAILVWTWDNSKSRCLFSTLVHPNILQKFYFNLP